MPGSNCAIVNCGTHRGTNKVLSFFKIRQPKDPQWEALLIKAVNRSDPSFNKDKATICSRHFSPDCIKISNAGRCSLIPGSLPTLWMPQKSIETTKLPPRKSPVVRTAPELPEIVAYYNFGEILNDSVCRLPSPWINLNKTEEELIVGIVEESMVKLRVIIKKDFTMTISVLGVKLKSHTYNPQTEKLHTLLKKLCALKICMGVFEPDLQEFAQLPTGLETEKYFRHVVYLCGDTVKHASTVRSCTCKLLLLSEEVCEACKYVRTLLLRKQQRAVASESQPLEANHSLNLSKKKLKEELKKSRKHCKKVEKELKKFKKTLHNQNENVEISTTLHHSMKAVIESSKLQPLTKLFWEEQIKAFQCKGKQGMRWHPMMIRLAILLHSRSSAAYATLRETGVLHLPGESTLQDYSNFFHPQPGFSQSAIETIKGQSQHFKDHERFVVLLHDEMTIKSDLVFDRRSGHLVGYVNSSYQGNPGLASHALVFYVVGVNTSLSASLGFFGTLTASADNLFPLFWKAVGLLEKVCLLKVIASTSDKATPNQRLYDMHGTDSLCFKTINFHARDREIFFISDPPHLIKTVRNNLANSGAGKHTRFMWLNGKHILWQHIVDVYNRDCMQELRMTKLTADHVYLSPVSVMNVKLAAQVLSERVGKVMQQFGGADCEETAKFILMMDSLFDCLNGRAKTEGMNKRKPNLNPYTSVNDPRFAFFDEVISYLNTWKESIQNRSGFTQSEKNKMFLSSQTYKGLLMTLKSFPEMIKYLLLHGVEFVLGNRFCQDPIEKHFGRQRALGRRCDNPTLWAFGYNENKLCLQRSLALVIQPRGNVSRKRQADDKITISNSPLKKKRRN